MMKKIFSMMLALSVFFLMSCGSGSHDSGNDGEAINITADQLDVKMDPVCEMSMEKYTIADTMTYNGKLYGFCNSGCKQEFKENPEKYISQMQAE